MSQLLTSENRRFPLITLIIAGLLLFFFLLAQYGIVNSVTLSMVPAAFADNQQDYGSFIATILTLPKMFTLTLVHDGWGHLIGNLIFLLILAPQLESRMGTRPFLLLWLIGALVSSTAALIYSPITFTLPGGQVSMIKIVGASGPIAAVLGGVLVLCPRNIIGILHYPRAPLAVLKAAFDTRDWQVFYDAFTFPEFVVRSWMVVIAFALEQVSVLLTDNGLLISSGSAVLHLAGVFTGIVVALLYPYFPYFVRSYEATKAYLVLYFVPYFVKSYAAIKSYWSK